MRTKFILHGGFTKGKTEENNGEFYTEILKDAPEGAKILLVCFAKDDERVPIATERVKIEFNKSKWQKRITFDVANEQSFVEQIKFADVVYFHGGTTLKLLEVLKKFPNLKDSLSGKIVAGESAGANVFGKFFYSPSADKVDEGLGFLPLKIIPHYSESYKGKLDNVGQGLESLLLPEYEFKVFEKYMDIKKKTAETYDKIASGYSAGHFAHFWIEEFDFYKNIINGNKVIDLGCGAGRDAAVFVENGFDYTGIDASEGMLKVASERVPKGKFQPMDFSKTIFQDGEFDGFWVAASFLHIPKKDVAGVLQEAKRITKNDGVGFVSVKEKNGMDEGMIEENKYGGISRYFSFYTQDEFKNILEQNGFSVIKMSTHTEDDERKTNWLCYFVKI